MDRQRRDGFQLGAMGWIVLSPVLAVAVLVTCAYTLWSDGAGGLYRLADREAAYVSAAVGDRARVPASMAEMAYQAVAAPTSAATKTAEPASGESGELGQITHRLDQQILTFTQSLFEVVGLALWLVALRLGVLLLSLPLFALAVGVGVVDGAAQRYLRRVSGARESSFLYHRAKHISRAVIVGLCLLYLAAPVPLDPRMVLLPAAIAVAFSLRTATRYFKKYL